MTFFFSLKTVLFITMLMAIRCHSIPHEFGELIKVLQCEGKILIDWFIFNCMQANPNKFQAIAAGKRTHKISIFQVWIN